MPDPTRITGDGSEYVGKRLLIGISHRTHDGHLIRQEQFHGLIVEAGQAEIVIERADTGERVSLPPELDAAGPGEYRLRSTGEVVVNPDYLAKWTITHPAAQKDSDQNATSA